jgi:hypothetical protein
VIVGCQKGLRSLAAAEQLSRAGYKKIAWINGGFDTAKVEDLQTTNGKDIRWVCFSGLLWHLLRSAGSEETASPGWQLVPCWDAQHCEAEMLLWPAGAALPNMYNRGMTCGIEE